jgi:branched-chain amino acid transport system ATP-binding protein
VLELKNISVSYGSICAVKGVSLIVETGEAVSLIGANGAGKTTILQTISGLLRPTEGDILLDGKSIAGISPGRIVSMGLCHVPEGRQVFSGMSVWENLRLGAYLLKKDWQIRARMDEVFHLFPILSSRLKQPAGTLSGGEQQMLAIGRGLMGKPRVLLLDEPSLGLSPLITRQVFDVLKDLGRQGVTMLLVEQNAYEALGITGRTYVLENGAVSLSGNSKALAEDPHIKESYLGR